MNAGEALEWSCRRLKRAGIPTYRLDSLVLLEDCSDIDRAKLLAEPSAHIEAQALSRFRKQVKLRSEQMPIAYIRGKTEFYGREFLVDERVLEPRPESETLIDELKTLVGGITPDLRIIDVGTGSGALIISAKLEMPEISAYGLDISSDCLEVSALNSERHKTEVKFLKSDLLDNVLGMEAHDTVLIANLPYVPETWQINPPAMREPAIAIFGGKDGLRLYDRLFRQASGIGSIKWILTESMPPQHEQLASIASANHFRQSKQNDFIQIFSRY